MIKVSRRSVLTSAIMLGADRATAFMRAAAVAAPVSYRQNAAEAAAAVTPTDLGFPPGDVRRYGATLDGVTDDTEALVNWARVGGKLVFPVARPAIISAPVRLIGNTTIAAVPGAMIRSSTADITFFEATAQTRIRIRGLHFRQTAAGKGAYVAAVALNNCSRCLVENCEFDGMQWAGVQLANSTNCRVRGNFFHDWLGTVQDAADVCVYEASAFNLVDDNRMQGGGEHGILCQDPYRGKIPNNNVFSNNTIGRHSGYGITVYCPGIGGAGDSNNRLVNNDIEDIQGSFSSNRSSGAGIYVTGFWAGGTQVTGNRIRNCCAQTIQRSLAPGGIGISGIAGNASRPVLKDNVITAMTQGDGIVVVSSPGGCVISGGRIEMPATNDGVGAGGASLMGCGIRIENSNRVSVHATRVVVNGGGNAMLVQADGAVVSDIDVSGGSYTSAGAGAALRVYASDAVAISNLLVSDVRISSASVAAPAVQLAQAERALLRDVVAVSEYQPALTIQDCPQLRISGGSYRSSGPAVIRTAGQCTGSRVENSVDWGGAAGSIDNAGIGFHIDGRRASPGTWVPEGER
jgi:parallel beta-helix repeat protein